MTFATNELNVTAADRTVDISLNLSALAEENMGSAVAELTVRERAKSQLGSGESDEAEGSEAAEEAVPLPPASETSMQDYYQLQQNLLLLTLAFTAAIFFVVWGTYSLNIALNYVIGAVTGLVYFRMLAKSVGGIGREKPKPSSGRLAIFVGVMVVSTQWQQLSILPVFLGFLTYKAALISYVIWTAVMPQPEAA
ncbi:MAG: ATP synthase subunit I [Cyanobacteria bacterium P01_D01_bin.36]